MSGFEPDLEPVPKIVPPARKRRQKRAFTPVNSEQKIETLKKLAHRLTPSIDFFLASVLSGLLIAVAMYVDDAPILYLLGALAAPFLAPQIGLAMVPAFGTFKFFFQSFGAAAIGCGLVFASAFGTGWAATYLPERQFPAAAEFASFNALTFGIFTIAAAVVVMMMVRFPDKRPTIPGVVLSYGLYIPLGISGFAFGYGLETEWVSSLVMFGLYLGWLAFIGMVFFIFFGLRPKSTFGVALAVLELFLVLTVTLGAGLVKLAVDPPQPKAQAVAETTTPTIAAVVTTAAPFLPTTSPALPTIAAATRTPTAVPPTPTASIANTRVMTATVTPTNTLVPTLTPTMTISPQPTPFYATIAVKNANGAVIRSEPRYDAPITKSLLNGMLVEVLPGEENRTDTNWVKVVTNDNIEGWIYFDLLSTNNPYQ